MRVVQSDARRAGARCAGVVGACGWQPKRTRPERRTRPCSRPLRARDRWHFSALVCSALAAADGQTVRRLDLMERARVALYRSEHLCYTVNTQLLTRTQEARRCLVSLACCIFLTTSASLTTTF